jgi:hypothetical protein
MKYPNTLCVEVVAKVLDHDTIQMENLMGSKSVIRCASVDCLLNSSSDMDLVNDIIELTFSPKFINMFQ